MSSKNQLLEEFTQDAVDHLLRHFDGEGPEEADDIVASCQAFDSWISKQSTEKTRSEAELDSFRAEIWFMRGTLANAAGDVGGAMSFFRGSIERAERTGNVTRQILGLRSIARCYEYAGMQAESTQSIFEALDLADGQGDDRATALALHGLSALYEAQGAYEQLFESADRTRAIAERIGDPHLLARAYGALSLSCGFLDRPEEGIAWVERALDLCDANGLEHTGQILSLNLIFLYPRAGRVADAVAFADDQREVIAALPSQHAAAIYVDVAEVNIAAGNLTTASEMLALASGLTDGDLMQAHLLRYYLVSADLHTAQGQEAAALAMMRRYVEHDRDVRGREAQSRLVAVERHFAAEIKAKTDEIHHLRTVDLVEKNDQLSNLIQQKDEILHVVVHDLRNPLAAAQLLGESLIADLHDQLDDDALDRLRSIGDAAMEMRRTIDTLLDLPDAKVPSNPAPASTAIRLAVRDARKDFAERNVTFEESILDVDLVVDAALLRRSVDDLLWNAVESVGTIGAVHVSVRPMESGAQITMIGTDVRFDEQTHTGRSLYIARRLIERMNGSLSFSPFTHGSEQTVTIDLRG